jgi:hypothetical protein
MRGGRGRTKLSARRIELRAVLGRIARLEPQVLACMHRSAWRGDGAALIRALAKALTERKLAAAV